MKRKYLIPIAIFALYISITQSCKRESPATTTIIAPQPAFPPFQPPPQPPPNIAPNAGQDQWVFLPTTFCSLYGSNKNNISDILWKKISGPGSVLIENPDSLVTMVRNLQSGVYQFELAVSERGNLKGMDTCAVIVRDIVSAINLENQAWIFPWYNSIEVKNFYTLIPPGSQFEIFIKRDTKPYWVEVSRLLNTSLGGTYEYFVETRPNGAGIYNYGSLYILYYGGDASDSPDVKIVF